MPTQRRRKHIIKLPTVHNVNSLFLSLLSVFRLPAADFLHPLFIHVTIITKQQKGRAPRRCSCLVVGPQVKVAIAIFLVVVAIPSAPSRFDTLQSPSCSSSFSILLNSYQLFPCTHFFSKKS